MKPAGRDSIADVSGGVVATLPQAVSSAVAVTYPVSGDGHDRRSKLALIQRPLPSLSNKHWREAEQALAAQGGRCLYSAARTMLEWHSDNVENGQGDAREGMLLRECR